MPSLAQTGEAGVGMRRVVFHETRIPLKTWLQLIQEEKKEWDIKILQNNP